MSVKKLKIWFISCKKLKTEIAQEPSQVKQHVNSTVIMESRKVKSENTF